MVDNKLQEDHVRIAFSKQAAVFDEENEGNQLVIWVRERVRKEVEKYLKESDTMLELNCGTGIDTLYFAAKGHEVLATDISPAMLEQLRKKTEPLHLEERVKIKELSFTQLDALKGQLFDCVFSNFGGLNCTDQLDKVLASIGQLIKPGGYCSLVIMPKICPWEIITIIKGNFKLAFRRFKKGGSMARVEGAFFKCYYYQPHYVMKHMSGFKICSLKALCITVPPPHNESFAKKHPKLFRVLEKIEVKICSSYPFNRWGDHYIITLQKAL